MANNSPRRNLVESRVCCLPAGSSDEINIMHVMSFPSKKILTVYEHSTQKTEKRSENKVYIQKNMLIALCGHKLQQMIQMGTGGHQHY